MEFPLSFVGSPQLSMSTTTETTALSKCFSVLSLNHFIILFGAEVNNSERYVEYTKISLFCTDSSSVFSTHAAAGWSGAQVWGHSLSLPA